jgi:hypothetical protein
MNDSRDTSEMHAHASNTLCVSFDPDSLLTVATASFEGHTFAEGMKDRVVPVRGKALLGFLMEAFDVALAGGVMDTYSGT